MALTWSNHGPSIGHYNVKIYYLVHLNKRYLWSKYGLGMVPKFKYSRNISFIPS